MTDWRALCAELAHEVEQYAEDRGDLMPECAERARAALVAEADGPAVPESREPASVVGEPSDVGLLELMPQQFREDLATVSRMAAHGAGTGVTPGLFRVSLNTGALDYARAVLARYGHQPAPPVEGEVGELALKELERTVVLLMPVTGHKKIKRFDTIRAALKRLQVLENKADLSPAPVPAEEEVAELAWWLRSLEDASVWFESGSPEALKLIRAADLLEQRQAAPAPVPVSERLPGPQDCDAEGRCWWFLPTQQLEILRQSDAWSFRKHIPRKDDYCRWTHWLPAHALPLPSGEVE